ncbi:hypothetical protein E3N88_18508 [Mikania micrantha]|uniref:Uncharacterized protein n=1 Tax=Mikania micrantha TaxID=192012 RepID=A0A5N6NKP7_9ASTR|nr:hypothetical protein E3N88_18508 [Mikania micrantha]
MLVGQILPIRQPHSDQRMLSQADSDGTTWVHTRVESETDPAVEALATLITEQLVAVLPGIITRIRNSEEFARNFPLLAAEKKEPEGGETSRK